MLVHVTRQVDLDADGLSWLEGELVRHGAWDAHVAAGGGLTIAVSAPTRTDADLLVDKLLERVVPLHRGSPAVHT
jgi:hypothetical protein